MFDRMENHDDSPCSAKAAIVSAHVGFSRLNFVPPAAD
jgi:hypothetical protein